jgi:hypothetical protein
MFFIAGRNGTQKKKVLFDENIDEGESVETCTKVAWIFNCT